MEHLLINHYETAAVILFGIGFLNLLLQNNLVKKGDRRWDYGQFCLSVFGIPRLY